MRTAGFWCLLGSVLVVLGAWGVQAQNANNLVEIKIDKNTKITDLLDQIQKTTGRPILYDPTNARVKGEIAAGFSHSVPRDRLFDTFRSILAFFELTLVKIGPEGYEIFLVLDSRSTNNLVRNRAIYVDEDRLEDYKDRDGVYIAVAVQLRYIENLVNLRQALARVMSPAAIGHVQEVPGSNSVILMDYAPTVYAARQLIRKMDLQPEGKRMRLEFIELQYAYADEVADIISELVAAQRQAVVPGRRTPATAGASRSPEPRILAYEPKNALVIAATEDDFALIEGLIERFDQEGVVGSTVEVIRLKHVAAEDLADTLGLVLEGLGGVVPGVGGDGGRPRTPQQPRARPTGPGIRRTGGRPNELEPQVVPDPGTNSVIITGDRKTIEALQEIIAQIDQPKHQVLIEAALISLSATDDFQLGIELAGADKTGLDDDGDESAFGVTNFALSTFQDNDGDGIPDINLPNALSTPGGGLVAGVFRQGTIPVLLTAIQRLNRAKIVSMPAVVTYDNEGAELSATSDQPVADQSELSSGSLQTGFTGFESAGVTLTVSPHISADNYLRLDISLEVSSFSGEAAGAGLPPPKQTNTIHTTIALPDEHTVVMGGLISEEQTTSESKVPLLGDLPLVGYLFKSKTRAKSRRNLFIFITPHILRQKGADFEDLHRQTWIAKLKAEELIEKLELHNQRFAYEEREEGGGLDISSLVDAGRWEEVPPEDTLTEAARLRRETRK
ncbi:MAG: secretin N-terminal domain-containing protein [Planctomycetota bacterium]